ncbi:hypothetical protein WBP07_12080 [Novosphingobium sp. BL-8A]|uniref:FliH/SctL family protein n=1 Tax=Novosphingobium sp. BL-8A TaxID=3127639 RepID=UPI0037576A0A
MAIEPFGFDRVFRFASAEAEEKEGGEAVHEQLAALEARIERMREEHSAELAHARTDGFEAGLAQARHERDAALLAAADALHAGLDDIARRFEDVADHVACEAGSVALLAAEMLAGHAVALEPARAIEEALARALEQVARGTRITVRVHPTMREDIERIVAMRQTSERRSQTILVVEDGNVAPADARIGWAEGGLGVDAAARRKAVLAELAGLLSSEREDASSASQHAETAVEGVAEAADSAVETPLEVAEIQVATGFDAAA